MSKELKKMRPDRKDLSSMEDMFVRGRTDKRDFKNKSIRRSRSNTGSRKYYTCNKEGHFKRDYLEKKKNGNGPKEDDNGDADMVSESEGSVEVLVL